MGPTLTSSVDKLLTSNSHPKRSSIPSIPVVPVLLPASPTGLRIPSADSARMGRFTSLSRALGVKMSSVKRKAGARVVCREVVESSEMPWEMLSPGCVVLALGVTLGRFRLCCVSLVRSSLNPLHVSRRCLRRTSCRLKVVSHWGHVICGRSSHKSTPPPMDVLTIQGVSLQVVFPRVLLWTLVALEQTREVRRRVAHLLIGVDREIEMQRHSGQRAEWASDAMHALSVFFYDADWLDVFAHRLVRYIFITKCSEIPQFQSPRSVSPLWRRCNGNYDYSLAIFVVRSAQCTPITSIKHTDQVWNGADHCGLRFLAVFCE